MQEDDRDEAERLVQWLRKEGLDQAAVPPELQAKVERRIEAAFATRRVMGWGSTALISGAATLVLGLANQGSFNPPFVVLLTLAAALYGLGVRQLAATPGSASERSA